MKMLRWEYKILILTDDEERGQTRLNSFGAAGWEIVGVGGRFQEAQYVYLKRPCEKEEPWSLR